MTKIQSIKSKSALYRSEYRMIRLETYLILLQERDVELQDSRRTRDTQEMVISSNHLPSQVTERKRMGYTMPK